MFGLTKKRKKKFVTNLIEKKIQKLKIGLKL